MYSDPKYTSITEDKFPPQIEISFVEGDNRQTLVYAKVCWETDGVPRSLRYGDNPGQAAALYRLINGNLILGDVENIQPGSHLASKPELLQVGKHPSKINLTDADRALGLLRFLADRPAAVMIKHGNPSGVAHAGSIDRACEKAIECDRVSSFGGCMGLNEPVNLAAAEAIIQAKADVVIAPDFEPEVMDLLSRRPTLRVLRVKSIEKIAHFMHQPVVDFNSLMDGGLVVQWSQIPKLICDQDLKPAAAVRNGNRVQCRREVSQSDRAEMEFAWKVVCSMSSNAVVYVKNGATVGIGTGQQDSLTAVEVARDKAYRKLADHIALNRFSKLFTAIDDRQMIDSIMSDVQELRGGLIGSILASDAFFPTPDCVKIAQQESVSGIIQPGGAIQDDKVIQACNDAGIPIVFTGQRSFVG